MARNSSGSKNQPHYSSSGAPDDAADLTEVADYAAAVGNRKAGTNADRLALSGADKAVKTVLPIIDDFRFGSAYSPRTGRTEPTLTVGKRISDRLRANVVTGLTDNRDVRSNVEWRLNSNTSILGNYDNLSDVASRGLGNIGADFRVRLEF